MVDLDETTVLLVTFVVLLVPFPLTSFGTTMGPEILWQIGLALLVVAGVVPPLTRFVFESEEDQDDDEDDDDEAATNGEGGSNDEAAVRRNAGETRQDQGQ